MLDKNIDSLAIEYPHISLYYEDFARNPSRILAAVFEFIGVDSAIAESLEPDTARQNPETIAQLVENYGDVCAALRGTQYEWFLNEEQ